MREGRNILGRAEDCTFLVRHSSVSERHCEVTLTGVTVQVRDLDSTQGTFINGSRIQDAVLEPGPILRLGAVEMVLLVELPQYSTEPAPGLEGDPHAIRSANPAQRHERRFWKRRFFWVMAVLFLLLLAMYASRGRFGWFEPVISR